VVDVRAAVRDATVVQNNDAGVQVLGEDLGDALFAGGAARPHGLVGRGIGEREP